MSSLLMILDFWIHAYIAQEQRNTVWRFCTVLCAGLVKSEAGSVQAASTLVLWFFWSLCSCCTRTFMRIAAAWFSAAVPPNCMPYSPCCRKTFRLGFTFSWHCRNSNTDVLVCRRIRTGHGGPLVDISRDSRQVAPIADDLSSTVDTNYVLKVH